MKYLKLTLLVTGLTVMISGYSQMSYHSIAAVSWEIAFPTGNNFLSKSSLAGGRLEYRQMLKPNLSVGVGFSWNSFDQYVGSKTYKSSSGAAVTTDMVREIYTAPITLIVHYYPKGNKMLKPYIGIGLGGQYAEQNAYFNIYEVNSYGWGFVFRPEIGGILRFNSSIGALVTFSYNYSTNKNKAFNTNSLQQFGINVGLAGLF